MFLPGRSHLEVDPGFQDVGGIRQDQHPLAVREQRRDELGEIFRHVVVRRLENRDDLGVNRPNHFRELSSGR